MSSVSFTKLRSKAFELNYAWNLEILHKQQFLWGGRGGL